MTRRANKSVDGGNAAASELIYRQSACTRLTHWLWAACLFFLLLSGLQIFNAHPALYLGDQSGFGFDNDVLRIGAAQSPVGLVGLTEVFGVQFETTGLLGISGEAPNPRAFPAWATIPSHQDLATGRVVHFFFAWVLFFTLAVWLLASLLNGHLRRDLTPTVTDLDAFRATLPTMSGFDSITAANTTRCRS